MSTSCSQPQVATNNGVRYGRSNWFAVTPHSLALSVTYKVQIDAASAEIEPTTFRIRSNSDLPIRPLRVTHIFHILSMTRHKCMDKNCTAYSRCSQWRYNNSVHCKSIVDGSLHCFEFGSFSVGSLVSFLYLFLPFEVFGDDVRIFDDAKIIAVDLLSTFLNLIMIIMKIMIMYISLLQ